MNSPTSSLRPSPGRSVWEEWTWKRHGVIISFAFLFIPSNELWNPIHSPFHSSNSWHHILWTPPHFFLMFLLVAHLQLVMVLIKKNVWIINEWMQKWNKVLHITDYTIHPSRTHKGSLFSQGSDLHALIGIPVPIIFFNLKTDDFWPKFFYWIEIIFSLYYSESQLGIHYNYSG